ncbi:hypothetical protein AB0J80_28075 [Actinoplanes sp. NPDC049548]|uniref:hypothetical protein n=1 Tax=Actinoplanes sp. NPDC049548 TaxID=3155152 RepID=UPI00343C711A
MLPQTDLLTAARTEALFTSDLSAHSRPTDAEVTEAIRRAVVAHGGVRGCAAEVAAAFGDHPDVAVARMRWARELVRHTYPRSCRGGRRIHRMPVPV